MPHEVIMNLPASATEFLDVFIGYGRRYEEIETVKEEMMMMIPLPRIHVYGFSVAADPVSDMAKRAAAALQCHPEDICVNPQVGGLGKCKKRKLDSTTATATTNEPPVSIDRNAENDTNAGKEGTSLLDLTSSIGSAHIVRDVAPNKVMVCLSFVLPKKVCYIVISLIYTCICHFIFVFSFQLYVHVFP